LNFLLPGKSHEITHEKRDLSLMLGQTHTEASKVKKTPVIYLLALLFMLLLSFGCSRKLSTEDDFKEWLRIVYERETGLQADKISICSWEGIPQEILRKAPDLDGLKVQAVIFTFSTKDIPEADHFIETTVHYVYCNYYRISDEWYLHASSWGGGFWKQGPAEWGRLVQDCKDKVEQFKSAVGMELPERK